MAERATVRGAWREDPITAAVAPVSWITTLVYDFAMGIVFLLGGPQRIMSPSFATLRDFGGHLSAGVAFTAVAIFIGVAAASTTKVLAVALTIGAILNVVLAAGFFTSAIAEPQAAWIGPIPFLFAAAIHVIRARFYWRFTSIGKADVAS